MCIPVDLQGDEEVPPEVFVLDTSEYPTVEDLLRQVFAAARSVAMVRLNALRARRCASVDTAGSSGQKRDGAGAISSIPLCTQVLIRFDLADEAEELSIAMDAKGEERLNTNKTRINNTPDGPKQEAAQ